MTFTITTDDPTEAKRLAKVNDMASVIWNIEQYLTSSQRREHDSYTMRENIRSISVKLEGEY